MRYFFVILVFIVTACNPLKDDGYRLTSPDGTIQVDLGLTDGYLQYSVTVDGRDLIKPSGLGLEMRGQPNLLGSFAVAGVDTTELLEDWTPVWGQEKQIHSHSHELILHLRESQNPGRFLDISFRVFDDGVAFRYHIPAQEGVDSIFISSENSEFNFKEDARTWWNPRNFDSYEMLYQKTPLSQVEAANTPLTMIMKNGLHVCLHEADLTNYAGMALVSSPDKPFGFRSDLAPWPDGDLVKAQGSLTSPWRTLIIGRSAADLLNSRMILNLNPPNTIEDPSWIKPMKYMGIWWGMHIGKETWVQGPKHGATTANAKTYIDFAADNQIQGVLIEGWNQGWEKWGQAEAFMMTEPYADFDIVEITRYARERGVVLIGHHETGADAAYYESQLEAAFAYCQDLGIPAVKTGYVGAIRPAGQLHHGQWMVEHYRRVVKMAAKYRVSIDVHEPIKPTGIERTWPNMMTREGARGMEYNAWSEGNPPDHTTILPFTRILAGPMDYTPGIFDLKFDRYKPDNAVHTTLAKQLALTVVLYSPLQMAADLPENYVHQPAFQFIRDLKLDWDETQVIRAEIGEEVALARRVGTDWFIGAITNEKPRNFSLPMSALISEPMVAECYVDGVDAHWEANPTSIFIGTYQTSPIDTLKAVLAPGGGLAVRLRTLRPGETPAASPLINLSRDQQQSAATQKDG